MDHHYKRSEKAIDQSTLWSEWILDEKGYWYSYRRGPTGVEEYKYFYTEPEYRSDIPRTSGPTNHSVASNQSMYLASISKDNATYTASQTGSSGGFDNDVTPIPSYTSSAPINNNYNTPNTFIRNDGTVPNTNISNPAWHSSYPSTSNASWQPPGNVATSSIEATIHALNSMSLTTPRAPPQAFDTQVSQRLPVNTKHIFKEPNSGNVETLDPRYQTLGGLLQDDFWRVGRVFMMLWTEPAQPKVPNGGGTRNGSHFSTTYLGGEAYSEIRRFVVVSKGYGSSICCPIHTYSNQATFKSKLPSPKDHTIIYTGSVSPGESCYEDENGNVIYEDLVRDHIQVIAEREGPDSRLHPLSRLNYSKVYTVEHYVRVLNIGMVASKSMDALLYDSGWSSRPIAANPPRSNLPSKKSPAQSSSHHNKHHKPHKPSKDRHN